MLILLLFDKQSSRKHRICNSRAQVSCTVCLWDFGL